MPKKITTSEDATIDRRDNDSLWKDIVERFFYPMLKRAIPSLYADADMKIPPRFLDKELKKATYQVKGGKYNVDLLVEVPLKDGANEWVLLHLEVQGRGGESLPLRMYRYKSLIFCMFEREPAALALVTDKRPGGEPKFYESRFYDTVTRYEYNNIVVSELDECELFSSDNPFDLVLLAAQRGLKSRNDERRKHAYLRELLRLLGDRRWGHEDKRRLLLFIEKIVDLRDRELKLDILQYEEELDKEGKIMYVSIVEEFYGPKWKEKALQEGRQEGRQEGLHEGKLETARNLLNMGMAVDQIAQATELPEEEIRKLLA